MEIKAIKRAAVKKADSDFVNCAQYVVQLQIKMPKSAAGMTVFDRIRVGTPEDPDAKKKATWEVSEGGPARLNRLLKRSGTTITDEDEEWIADAIGRTVVAPIVKRGEYTNVGLYYRESDKDCPVIGLADGAKGPGGKRVARPVETEEEPETEEVAPAEVDEGEEEAAPPPKKKVVAVAKPAEDEDEDKEDVPPKKMKLKAKKPAADEEED